MNYDEITKLYREIGKKYREWGAEQVVLLKSRSFQDDEMEMMLEIAVDGMMNSDVLRKKSNILWPHIHIKILDLNENPNLIEEVIEDGMIL